MAVADLQALLNAYQTAKGSSNSVTVQNNVSSAGANQVLQQLLGSVSGLSAITQGQKSAGLYNSSTNQLLTNDLLSRTTGEVAKLNSSTTTGTKKNGAIGVPELLGMLGATAGKSILGPTVNGLANKYGIDKWGQDIADSLGITGGAGGGLTGGSTNLFEGLNPADFSGNIAGSSISSMADYGGSVADAATSSATDAVDEAVGSSVLDAGTESGASSLSDIFSNIFG